MKENNLNIQHENSQGFSLLETSIALIIMMVVTLGTASLFVYATNYNTGSSDRAACLAIAQQKMERLRKASFDAGDFLAGTTTETASYNNHTYTLTTTVCDSADCGGDPTRKAITVQVAPHGSQNWMNSP